jgi:hypothetical protein
MGLVDGAKIAAKEAVMCIHSSTKEEICAPGDKSILIEKLKDGIAAIPPIVVGRNLLIDNLGTLTFLHWKHYNQDQAALEEAITIGEMAIPAALDEERKAIRLMTISACQEVKYEEYSHSLVDFQCAISRIQQVIITRSETYRSDYLKFLHGLLVLRFQLTHHVVDLERAVRITE